MVAKLVMILSLAAAACAALVPVKVAYEPEAPAHYEFQYSVHDDHTGDIKQQKEAREGDNLHGSYSLVQPDGVLRIVEYTSSKEHGFNAQVRYEGHPTEAPAKVAYAPVQNVAYAPVQKVAYAPVQKVAYAPVQKVAYAPVQKIAYAPVQNVAYAPVQKVAYAPVQKVAYAPAQIQYTAPKIAYATAPVAKVAYASPLSHVTFSSPAISYHH